jgi:hypothetical protein
MEQMYQTIADMCIEKGIKIAEIPDFVYELTKNPIPFSAKIKGSSKEALHSFSFGKHFHYEQEEK